MLTAYFLLEVIEWLMIERPRTLHPAWTLPRAFPPSFDTRIGDVVAIHKAKRHPREKAPHGTHLHELCLTRSLPAIQLDDVLWATSLG